MTHRTRQEWLALFEQHKQSGLTIKAFCQERELNPAYFSKRRGELLTSEHEAHSPFIQLNADKTDSAAMTLVCGHVELKLPISVSADWLASLVKALA